MTIAEVNKAIRLLYEEELAREITEDLKSDVASLFYRMYDEGKANFMDLRIALDLLGMEPEGEIAELDQTNRKAALSDYQLTELEERIMSSHHLTLEAADQEIIKMMFDDVKSERISLEAFYRFTWALGYGIDPQYLILSDEDRKNHNISFFRRK